MKIEAWWPRYIKISQHEEFPTSIRWKITISDGDGEWAITLMVNDEFMQDLEQKLVKVREMRTEENP